ncbi:hypothetical protein ACFV0R_07480 [Streptomyces sp. NPDC059578]|uniref:hypothetical protein n=1 Tax=unclassified Streptomyces TaxID=2593676 RepID=UPI00365DB7FD
MPDHSTLAGAERGAELRPLREVPRIGAVHRDAPVVEFGNDQISGRVQVGAGQHQDRHGV